MNGYDRAMRDLALFDFDGTVTNRDSFLLFLRYMTGPSFFLRCLVLAPRIYFFLQGRYGNHCLKEDFLRQFLAGRSSSRIAQAASCFAREILPSILRQQAMEAIRLHLQLGDRVIVVTATPEMILQPWCQGLGLELIGTRLEIEDGMVTGHITGRNCRGDEKVRRLKKRLSLAKYGTIYAYGDTDGDRPMLELAHISCFKSFRDL